MAHTGQKFCDINVIHPLPAAAEAFARFAELYAIEGEIRGKPAEQ